MKRSLLLLFMGVLCLGVRAEVRSSVDFDFDWKFSLSDSEEYASADYVDNDWRTVHLPHDWSIELEFDRRAGGSHGFLPGGIGWYRKEFTLPAGSNGKNISILFDGIFHQSDVYINGHHLGFHPYGFTSIEYDLTPYLNRKGRNVIAVRVDHSGPGARWYTGSGINRNVWLQIYNPVHVETYGTYVTTPVVSEASAQIDVVTTIKNESDSESDVTVSHRVLDADNKEVASTRREKLSVLSKQSADLKQSINLPQPKLWDTENPNLYTLETTVRKSGTVVDKYLTTFGVRTIKFDHAKGFFLNGKHMKLKGMCLHEDSGCFGTAVPIRAYERRLEILKEYGCNAIRCAHNQPPKEFLDLCDRMGFVVIDEAFDKWKSGYYEKYFDEYWQSDLRDMILRDRNHPSIILWSVGNEVQEAWNTDDEGVRIAHMLQDYVHEIEPTRPVNIACQNNHERKFSEVPDVAGYNYLEARLLVDYKTSREDQCFLITEELPYYRGEEGNIRAYNDDNAWNIIAANDFIAGGFIWSGVDYIGEAPRWPVKGWPTGLFDICMTEKPRAAYHRAMWNGEPMVRIAIQDNSFDIANGRDLWQWPHLVDHWNLPQSYMGMVIKVQTITNCERVELEQDGKVMGSRNTKDFKNNTIEWNIPYRPGKLVARGYNGDKLVAEYEIASAKEPKTVNLIVDRPELKADGKDLCHIMIELRDANGVLVQTDDRNVTVSIEGEGVIRGLDNGELRRDTPFAGTYTHPTYFGRALAIVQSTRAAGNMKLKVEVEGMGDALYVDILSK